MPKQLVSSIDAGRVLLRHRKKLVGVYDLFSLRSLIDDLTRCARQLERELAIEADAIARDLRAKSCPVLGEIDEQGRVRFYGGASEGGRKKESAAEDRLLSPPAAE